MNHYRTLQIVLFESNEILITFFHEIFVLISVLPYLIKLASLLSKSYVLKIFFCYKRGKMYTFSAIKTHKKIIKKESSHIFFKQNEFKIISNYLRETYI